MRGPLLVALLAFLGAAGCRSRVAGVPRDAYAGGAFSAVPGVGASLGGGKVLWRTETADIAVEGHLVRHPLDDKDIADDGFADSGRMTAIRLGAKHTLSPGHKRHAVFRYGAQLYRATGTPGIIDFPGDYFGFFVSAGFETDLSRNWTMGPEISVAVMEGEGSLETEVVPTLFWHFIFNF